MANLKWFCIVIVSLAVMSACKKTHNNEITYAKYLPLKVGNYWVYERYNIDTTGVATATGVFDSCYIEKDTLINGQTYYKQIRPSYPFTSFIDYSFIRDSLGYILGTNGGIPVSFQDFTTIISHYYQISGASDTILEATTKMADKDFIVTTPAGTFTTLSVKTTYNFYPNYAGTQNPRYMDTRYAENVGIVTETLPFYAGNPNPNYLERRLIRFNLN